MTGGTELNLVLWRYELQPDGDGTTLTEQWQLRNRTFFLEAGGEEEITRRSTNAAESIAATLEGMKAAAEER